MHHQRVRQPAQPQISSEKKMTRATDLQERKWRALAETLEQVHAAGEQGTAQHHRMRRKKAGETLPW